MRQEKIRFNNNIPWLARTIYNYANVLFVFVFFCGTSKASKNLTKYQSVECLCYCNTASDTKTWWGSRTTNARSPHNLYLCVILSSGCVYIVVRRLGIHTKIRIRFFCDSTATTDSRPGVNHSYYYRLDRTPLSLLPVQINIYIVNRSLRINWLL